MLRVIGAPLRKYYSNMTSLPSKGHLWSARQPEPMKHLLRPVNAYHDDDLKISHRFIPIAPDVHLLNVALSAESDIVKPTKLVCALDVSGSMNESIDAMNNSEISGFSRLDLVKHSMNLVISCLRPEDQLSIITFNSSAQCNLKPIAMDPQGKNRAQNIIRNIYGGGGTNMWDGLKMISDVLDRNDHTNTFSLLLTDGVPNINPPRGIAHEFLALQSATQLPGSLNTFGYGYDLDSELLSTLSFQGSGLFAHIPDYTMTNTVFINYIANCLATVYPRVDIHLKSHNHTETFSIGGIQAGQTRNILMPTPSCDCELLVTYGNKRVPYMAKYNVPPTYNGIQTIASMNADPQFAIVLLNQIIQKGLKDRTMILEDLDHLIGIITDLKNYSNNKLFLDALLTNIKGDNANDGQIYKAFGNPEWFSRWGTHYLKYLKRSHELQVCSNFKDDSLQYYGGKLFRELRTEIEDIFASLPIPQPSLSQHTFKGNFGQSFYRPSGPCFYGEGRVRMQNGNIKLVKQLVKGDVICNSEGQHASIVCVIKTKIPNGHTQLVNIKGFRVTPWHPIRIDSRWQFPCEIKIPMIHHCDYIYNFVLDQHHIITIDAIDVITLGHGFTNEKILNHPFFGSQAVLENLRTHPDYNSGLITIDKYDPKYDSEGMIKLLF